MANYRHPGGQRYRIELEALGDSAAPAIIRVRAALKVLLRWFRLRCRAIEEIHPGPGGAPASSPADPATDAA